MVAKIKAGSGRHGFQPGKSGNPAGRKPGTPNKATIEVRELARALVEDPEYRANLATRLKLGEAGPIEPLLWHYAYGKPVERVEHSGVVTVADLLGEAAKP